MGATRRLLAVAAAWGGIVAMTGSAAAEETPRRARVVVRDRVLHRLDGRLFGQFLERASFGEPGPEPFADPVTGRLPAAVVAKLREMRIPIVRFPGGTDADYIDWRDMVSGVPGRGPERPVTLGHRGQPITNRFGLDEYFALRDELGCQTILVANFRDAVARKVPLAEAAMRAAGLVAYCNAPVGAKLPPGMDDWPALRARNGREKPFRAEFIQIGNEWWLFAEGAWQAAGLADVQQAAKWYTECLLAYVERIRQVDRDVEIIIDANMGKGIEKLVLADPAVRREVRYAALHHYQPGPMDQLARDGQPCGPDQLSGRDWWNAWAAMPGVYGDDGANLALSQAVELARSLGYIVACTEWNWNGWGYARLDPPAGIDWRLAAGIGAAGFLHGLIRQAGDVRIATQSMLLGHRWHITAVRADPEGKVPPCFLPQGQATTFYNLHHGDRVLDCSVEGAATYAQPFQVGWAPPRKRVAVLDVVVTADDGAVYVHAINRDFDRALPVDVDLTALGALAGAGTHYLLTGPLVRGGEEPAPREAMEVTERPLAQAGGRLAVELPPRSASCLVVPRSR